MPRTDEAARPPARRTQEQRRTETRTRLLDAAVECLLELGYSSTTVAEVQERAGLARGTLLHHFPTKNELVVGAMGHLAARRVDQFRAEAELIPPSKDRLEALVDLAWSGLHDPAFFSAAELWVAARTDPDLRAALLPVEAVAFADLQDGLTAVLGPAYADDPRTPTLVGMTIDLLTGLSLAAMLTGDLGERRKLLVRWKRALGVLFGELPPDELLGPRARS
ncbi:TetR/AcrR family transcriptional regulator [Nocardioides sp. 1609]|uniref:TetR/AcrR family transcriptional regulator n=1 Tax=Nocardioides sp. 1609 TaxID=2508327 RepID=UPI00106F3B7B|nr:TetR/AcrR family transcriptional regulator [Nocardioides sp. 1609]